MAKHRIDIRGTIIPNDYKRVYDWYGFDSTCPRDVSTVLDRMMDGDEVYVYINSPGGHIEPGSEIYTLLRQKSLTNPVNICITGSAHSAASIIACAGYCTMSPTALMMVHCVSSYAWGNHTDMEHMAEVLGTADKALCTAYMAKAGMTEKEALDMMEHETWLTAEQAKERGLVDEIIFEDKAEPLQMVAAYGSFGILTQEQIERAEAMMGNPEKPAPADNAIELLQTKLNLMKRIPARRMEPCR